MSETPDATGPAVVPTGDAERPAAERPEAGDSRNDGARERQPIVKVRGARRARLLAAPGTSAEPAPADDRSRERHAGPAASGPNDAQLLRDVPPHY